MITCYPGSFLGMDECASYFETFGNPSILMTRVAINGPLPYFAVTGFAHVTSFEFANNLHPCCYVWFGKHFSEKRWVPTVLLRYMLHSHIFISLTISEAIISYKPQFEVWLPTPDRITLEEVIEEEWLREHPDFPEGLIKIYAPGILEKTLKNNESMAIDLGRRLIGKFTQGGKYDHNDIIADYYWMKLN